MRICEVKSEKEGGWKQDVESIVTPHHGRNLVEWLQVRHDLGFVSRLHASEASGPFDSLPLGVGQKVVKLAARVRLPRHVVVLAEDADALADGHRGALVVPGDHDDAYAGLAAQFHRANHLLPGRVEHAHAADERETQLEKGEKRGRQGRDLWDRLFIANNKDEVESSTQS